MRKCFVVLICVSLLVLFIGCSGSSGSNDTDDTTNVDTTPSNDDTSLDSDDTDPPTENTPPVALITTPAEGASYTLGDEISFSGTGTDTEDRELNGSSLVWTSDIDGELSTGETFTWQGLSTGAHQITLTATDSNGAEDLDTVIITVVGNLPDTGQNTSYTDTFGEDSDYNSLPQSYTKLDASGNDLDDSATDWVMVRDNVTGLIWEVKTDDGSVHDKSNGYTWDDAQDILFIPHLNGESFGGYSDWRLPTIKELSSLVNADSDSPAINTAYFPHTGNGHYWSYSESVVIWNAAWVVDFEYGRVLDEWEDDKIRVRAVRGETEESPNLIDNGDGTVTDGVTGLTWQQRPAGTMEWEEALTYCENLELAGYDNWRLPNRNELQSILDYNKFGPAFDTVYFSNESSLQYWTSTSYSESYAWMVVMGIGKNEYDCDKESLYNVRAVRGGTY